jgi:hypothetical protein
MVHPKKLSSFYYFVFGLKRKNWIENKNPIFNFQILFIASYGVDGLN